MSVPEVHKVMVDEASARILLATLWQPLTPLQVVRCTGLPVATVFRRIRQLERMGLLRAELRLVDVRGNDAVAFRCALRDGCILAEDGKLKVRFPMVAVEAPTGRPH